MLVSDMALLWLPSLGVLDVLSLIILGLAILGHWTLPEEVAVERELVYVQGVWLALWFVVTSCLQAEGAALATWITEQMHEWLFLALVLALPFVLGFAIDLVVCRAILCKTAITLHITAFVYIPLFFGDCVLAGIVQLWSTGSAWMTEGVTLSVCCAEWLAGKTRSAGKGAARETVRWNQATWLHRFLEVSHVIYLAVRGLHTMLKRALMYAYHLDRSLEFLGLFPHDIANLCLQLAVGFTIEVEMSHSTHRRGLGLWWEWMDSEHRPEDVDWMKMAPKVLSVWISATLLRLFIEYWEDSTLLAHWLYQRYVAVALQTLLEHVGLPIAWQ